VKLGSARVPEDVGMNALGDPGLGRQLRQPSAQVGGRRFGPLERAEQGRLAIIEAEPTAPLYPQLERGQRAIVQVDRSRLAALATP
jgi:hypothetical protein